ncbi:MAG: PIN domain-containing protein [Pyrinomonadaceae bacterium]
MELLNAIEQNTSVFVDTAAWIALLITRDELHAQATGVMQKLRGKNAKLVTSESVLSEFANALSPVKNRQKAVSFIDVLRSLANIEIIYSNSELFDKSLKLYRERFDKEWSLTGCASFVIMNETQIKYAFTSDKHFEQAGFTKLLET